MAFSHLHTHSDYSTLDGAMSVEQIAKQTKKLGMSAVALTDHGRAGGLLEFKKACEKEDIKPIYGIELYCSPFEMTRKENIEGYKPNYHLTILAKNIEGLQNIFRLSSIGWLEGFYYKPRVDIATIKKHSEGLVVLSGCGSGFIANALLAGKFAEAIDYKNELKKIFKDDFYIEVQDHGIDWQTGLKEALYILAKESKTPLVATQDAHYLTKEDAKLHKYITKLAAGDLEFSTDQMYFKSENQMHKALGPKFAQSIEQTKEIVDKCNVEWTTGRTIWPVYPIPKTSTPEAILREKAWSGFYNFFEQGTEEYQERLKYELKTIEKMGFSTYFLVVADFINWAKTHNIPTGPGRGSGAGSLVCYCLGITELDPIEYGLHFERFLNPDRVNLPDLDCDFSPEGRKLVMEYVAEKYGQNKTAQIGTYSEFKPRGALRDFARVCGYEPKVGEQLANLVPADIAGKSLTFDEVINTEPKILKTKYPEVIELARKAEKLKNRFGVHAAGVVISDKDLSQTVPLFRGKHDEIATQFDMYNVEELGLVKFDFLGLKNLAVIQEAIDLIKKTKNIEININSINTKDQKVFETIFQQGDLDGVFQFETSSGFKELCVRVKPRSIKDLSAITSLFRPGPLGLGLLDQYIAGRAGREVEYLLPELEPILKETYGVLVFQESIMRICTDLAGYTLAESDNMRKIVGKKKRKEMKKERDKFIDGCLANGLNEEKVTQLFDFIEGFALYSFNLSHAAAYSLISYRTAWLKTYYPEEFYTALLNNAEDQDDLVKYIHSCREHNIPIQPPDVNKSDIKFTLDNNTILFGLAGIKGIGEKGCKHLIDSRPDNGFNSLGELIKAKINQGIIKALAECGSLEEITDLSREQITESLPILVEYHKKLQKWEERKERIAKRELEIQEAVSKGLKPPRRLPKLPDPPKQPELKEKPKTNVIDRLQLERKTLGFYLTGHPLDRYPKLSKMAKYSIQDIKEGKAQDNEFVSIPLVVSDIKKVTTKAKKAMAILTAEDKTGRIEIAVFPKQWGRFKDALEEDSVSIIKSTVKKTIVDESTKPMVRLVFNDVNVLNGENNVTEMKPLYFSLRDGSIVHCKPKDEQNHDQWMRAVAFIKNLKELRHDNKTMD